jgi:hypothetical protein
MDQTGLRKVTAITGAARGIGHGACRPVFVPPGVR